MPSNGYVLDVSGNARVSGNVSASGSVSVNSITTNGITASGTISNTGVYTSTYHMDKTSSAVSIANGATITISFAGGMLLVTNISTGKSTIYLFGGGTTSAIGSNGAQVGTFATDGGNGYNFTNNTGGTCSFGMCIIKTRNGA